MKLASAISLFLFSLTLVGCGGGSEQNSTPQPTNSAPTLSGEPANAFVGKAYQFKPTVYDKEGDAITLSSVNLPNWLTLQNNSVQGTANSSELGSHSFTLKVSDGTASNQYDFTLQVLDAQETNTAPTISGQIPTAYANQIFRFKPNVLDKEDDTLTFSINNSPDWSQLDLTSGELSGTPLTQHIGIHKDITLSVSDGIHTVDFNFDIEVKSAQGNSAPTIEVSDQSALVGKPFTYQPTIADAQNDALSIAINNAPDWLNLNSTTGEVSGTPATTDVGKFENIKITVSDGELSNSGLFSITVSEEQSANTPPSVTASPKSAIVNKYYELALTISDKENDPLTVSIDNLPSWLNFDTNTAVLSGTPSTSDIGTYSNIQVFVSDGEFTTNLTLSIEVESAPTSNTAPEISGIAPDAEVNSAYSFIPTASDADGDTLRFAFKNLPAWAQFNTQNGEISGTPKEQDIGTIENIELTVDDGVDAASLVISITVNPAETENTAPIVSGTPNKAFVNTHFTFTPTVTDAEDDTFTFTLSSLPNWLSFNATSGTLSGTPTSDDVGAYPIILNVSDGKSTTSFEFIIEVVTENQLPELVVSKATARADEDFSLMLEARDADNDEVTISIPALPSWLNFNSETNTLSGKPDDTHVGTSILTIMLSDSQSETTVQFELTIDKSWLTLAVETGNALLVNDNRTILNAAIDEISSHKARFNAIKTQLFKTDSAGQKLSAINWDPTHDAAILQGQYPFNDTMLYTTHSNQSGGPDRVLPIAIAGSQTETTGRYIAYGANPFRNAVNAEMEQFMVNAFDWLTQTSTKDKSRFNVVLTQLDESYWFRDRSLTRAWLDKQYANVNYNEPGACDGSALASCIAASPDVIIISRITRESDDKAAILDGIRSALENDIPVIYIQHDGGIGDHGRALLGLMNITHKHDNYWWKLYLESYNPEMVFDALPSDIQAIKTLLTNFQNEQFDVDLTECATRSCPAESNTQSAFFNGANAVKAMFNQFDSQKINIFDSSNYRLNKLLILLADHYRQTVSYPMDKLTTNTVAFFKSLYADYAVYNVRDVNPVQPDMGNFSRSNFSHITPEHAAITLTAKPYFRSAGVYALPGQSFTVTRTDNQDVRTHIFINTLRTGATHIFNENRYNRPYLLQTQKIEIKPNESVTLTSSYGGPVQIAFDKKDLEVSFSFTHIGRHPHWRSADDDEIFASRMAEDAYDWAEIATPGFEVHSKLTKLEASLTGSIWPIASDFANATSRYTHNLVHVLAGFKGPGIDVVPEIHDFVNARALEVDTIDIVKHMNADQPTCGWGCSGNPYDAGWNFSPTGHGDLHELGHGIERASMRFDGYGGHSNTNFYSYFSKSIYEDKTGQPASCQSLPFEQLFNTLQQSKLSADPVAYMQANLTKSWSEHHALYLQLMMATQAETNLSNGWYIYPRLHIWEREFYRADNTDESWTDKKAGLGFDQYTHEELSSLSRNDWLYISLSEITQLDLTQWFNMYGFTVSNKAQSQVQSKGLKELEQVFYTSTGTGYCSSLDQASLPVDGTQVWPN